MLEAKTVPLFRSGITEKYWAASGISTLKEANLNYVVAPRHEAATTIIKSTNPKRRRMNERLRIHGNRCGE